jgi:hypothetical protein
MGGNMDEKQRLLQWMQEHGHDYRSLAAATGDTYSNIHMMTNGKREINDAFKWRFKTAFGDKEANKVFGKDPAIVEATTPEPQP